MSLLMAAYMTVSLTRPAFECKPLEALIKEMLIEKQVAYLSTAIDEHDNVIMFFVNTHNGDWYEIGVLPDAKNACIVLKGHDMIFSVTRRI